MRKLISIFIFVSWAFPHFLSGQDYLIDIKHYGIEEGLSHRNVHFALQDRRGLMWFGTDYGLNRFDGYNFKWITKEKHGLQSNQVKSAFLDKDGLLWLIYGSAMNYAKWSPVIHGIDIFNPITDEVRTFEDFVEGKTQFQATDFHSFTQKETGEIVFLTKKMKLLSYELDGTFKVVDVENQYNGITNFLWSENGYFWLSVLEGNQISFIAVDEKGEEIHHLSPDEPFTCVLPYKVKDNQNVKWIATFNTERSRFFEITPQGEFIDNEEALAFKTFNFDFTRFGEIAGFLDAGVYFVFNSEAGFYLFNKNQKESYPLNTPPHKIEFVNTLFVDSQGKIWVSTQFGIYLIQPKINHFTKIFNRNDEVLNPVRGLGLDENNALWIVKESKSDLWKFQLDNSKKRILNSTSVNQNQPDGQVPFESIFYQIGLNQDGNIVYSFPQNHFLKTDPVTYACQKFLLLDSLLELGQPWSYFEEEGKIWVGTARGIVGKWDSGDFQFTHLIEDSSRIFNHIYQFTEDQNRFWIISEEGLFLFDKTNFQVIERYWSGGKDNFHLPFDKLYHSFREEDGTFWLGTGGGLVHFNLKTGEYQQFTKADGLSNNTIYAVYPDEYDNLWLTSDYGIMRFHKTTHQVKTYLYDDGTTHNEFNRISHHQSRDGTLFFGGLNGVTAFHPKDFQSDSLTANVPLVVSKFEQFIGDENKLVNKTSELLNQNKITLAPNDPFFRIEFALLTFKETDKIQFAYKIEGTDPDWFYQKENFIRLSRLPYGQHLLRIKGQGADGQWSSQATTSFRMNGIHFADASNGWAVGLGGTIINTSNGGTSWSSQASGTSIALYEVHFTDSNNGWVAGDAGNVVHTSNGGSNWSTQSTSASGTLRGIYFTDTNNGWAVGINGDITHTSNGGTNWSSQTSGTSEQLLGVFFTDASNGWAVGQMGTIINTSNGRTNWSAQTSNTTETLIGAHFADANTGWVVGASGTILHTTNGGTTWTAQTSNTSNSLTGVHFEGTQTGWACGGSGTVLYTTDAGTTWTAQTTGTTESFNEIHFADSNNGWVTGGTALNMGVVFGTTTGGLPVEVISFTAHRHSQNIQLKWQTASEVNNEGFEVEWSTDNRTWENIGFVSGEGTTYEKQTYSFLHKNPAHGVNYYRLKQMDFDGAFEYSDVVSVELAVSSELLAVSVSPNPVQNDEVTLYIPVTDFEEANLEIYNSMGVLVQTGQLFSNQTTVRTEDLPKGIYLFSVKVEGQRFIRRVVVN